MASLLSIFGFVGCALTGTALAYWIASYVYVTKFYRYGIIAVLLIGVLLMVCAAVIGPAKRDRRALYLAIYAILFGSLMFALQASILVLSRLGTGVGLKGVFPILISIVLFWFSRKWVNELNVQRSQKGRVAEE